MTVEEMADLFKKHDDQYLTSNEEGPRDLAVILRLQTIAPVKENVVYASGHDEFWLAHDEERVAEAITEEDIIFFKQCGLIYQEGDGFSFFV